MSAGKGDDSRVRDWKRYRNNHDKIDWRSDEKLRRRLEHSFGPGLHSPGMFERAKRRGY